MPAASNRGLMLALSGVALLLAVTLWVYRPPAPQGAQAPLTVFSAHRASAILQDLVGGGIPHPMGSPANARLREAIVRRLSALGYSIELQTGFVCNDGGVCGSPVNIIAGRRGAAAEDGTLLLSAHYDSVPAGPGASDDGAGVAALLEIARILAVRPPPARPIVLLLTDGEEAGLLGALLFVRGHPLAGRVAAAVNLDARGTSGPSLMFETGSANTWLMKLYASAIARPMTNSLYYVVYKQLENDTDFTVFKNAGYQGFNFAFIDHVGRYHTPLDNVANADAGSIQHQGDNALAAITALADSGNSPPPIAESVFFDVLTKSLIAWPADGVLPAALSSLAVLLAQAVILLRRGALTGAQVLWGLTGALGMLVAGLALCAGMLDLAMALGKVPPLPGGSRIAHPLPMHLASAAIALLVAGGTGAALARRAGFWGLWAAAALLSAALSVATAVWIPSASFICLLTAGAAALGALPCMASGTRSRAPASWTLEFAALLPTFAMFGAIFPLLRFLYLALGSLAWPLSTLLLGVGTTPLLALLAASSRRARLCVMSGAALVIVGGALATLLLPTHSNDWPERINLEYWVDADTGRSRVLAQCDSLRLPASLAAAAPFDAEPRPRFDGSHIPVFSAPAPPLALAAPQLLLVSSTEPASQRGAAARLTLRLTSPRAAPEAFVVFPAGAHVARVDFAGPNGPVRALLHRLENGATVLHVLGLPAEGLEFSVDAAGTSPLAVQIFDQSFDFPGDGALQRARPRNATSSQDGDVTVVHRIVSLNLRPAAALAH